MSLRIIFNSISLVIRHPEILILSVFESEIFNNLSDVKMFEKPPPEENIDLTDELGVMIAATSGSSTVDPGVIWVAPTDVTKGHVG